MKIKSVIKMQDNEHHFDNYGNVINYIPAMQSTPIIKGGVDYIFISADLDSPGFRYYDDDGQNIFFKDVNQDNVIEIMEKMLNFSYDADSYWLPKKYLNDFITSLTEWFSIDENHLYNSEEKESNLEIGVANCIIIKKTPKGFFVLDTMLDYGSTFFRFMENFLENIPEDEVFSHSDSNYADNIYIGRNSSENENEVFYKYYQEGVLNSVFVFYEVVATDKMKQFKENINQNNVLLLGNFQDYIQIKAFFEENDIQVVSEWSEDMFVIYGDKPDSIILNNAKVLDVPVFSIDEFIKFYLKISNNS